MLYSGQCPPVQISPFRPPFWIFGKGSLRGISVPRPFELSAFALEESGIELEIS